MWRYEGIRREQWAHTAELLAMLYNANRGEGQQALSSDSFNLATLKPGKKTPDASPEDLAFCRNLFARDEA